MNSNADVAAGLGERLESLSPDWFDQRKLLAGQPCGLFAGALAGRIDDGSGAGGSLRPIAHHHGAAPVYGGIAMPGDSVMLKVYDGCGQIMGQQLATTDPYGYWVAVFQGGRRSDAARVSVEIASASSSSRNGVVGDYLIPVGAIGNLIQLGNLELTGSVLMPQETG